LPVSPYDSNMTDFEGFYRDNLRLVFAAAVTRTHEREQALDMTQETFLRAWRCFALVSALALPAQRAWLLTTVRNLAVDAWRRQELEEAANEPPSPPAETPAEMRLDIVDAVSRLPRKDQDIVLLRYIQGMNSREIGQSLGIPEGTVRRRLSLCRMRMAALLPEWATEGAHT